MWQNGVEVSTPFKIEPEENDKRDLVVKKIWRILREDDDNRELGYDQITYHILRHCEKMPLITWLTNIFRVQTKLRIIYAAYKLGFVSYISKMDEGDDVEDVLVYALHVLDGGEYRSSWASGRNLKLTTILEYNKYKKKTSCSACLRTSKEPLRRSSLTF